MYKPYLFEMLRAMGLHEDTDPVKWVLHVLDNIPDDELEKGLSEYNMYVTWVIARHSRSMDIVPRQRWARYAPAAAMPSRTSGNCCPRAELIAKGSAGQAWEFFGYELGHLPYCRYDAPEYKEHYP
jgi:hypothetical protein